MGYNIHAPYNFVPFSQKVLAYPWGTPPAYGQISGQLLTGELVVTVTALTPLYIGSSDTINPDFFRTPRGDYAIPGSSLRGLIRENMQILGHGCVSPENNRDIWGKQFLHTGLPAAHRKTGSPEALDLVSGILGYVNLDLGKTDPRPWRKGESIRESRRSRVSFGDLNLVNDAVPMDSFELNLQTPDPLYSRNYTLGTDGYESGFQLRGYKQYWLKTPSGADMTASGTTTMKAMPVGTAFRGTITFRNLHPEELGLVLWALRLEPGCFQPMGRGKPYGYGRTTISVDSLHLMDAKALYHSLTAGLRDATGELDGYVRSFQDLSREKLGADWEADLEDFFYIRSVERTDGYLPANTYRTKEDILPTIAQLRTPEAPPEPEPDDPEQLANSMAALLAKFSGNTNTAAVHAGKKKKKGRK